MLKILLSLFLLAMLFHSSYELTEAETKGLSALAQELYLVEDKLDHILYHFNHDPTRKRIRKDRYGTRVEYYPKNINSIHQTLKAMDELNIHSGMYRTMTAAQLNAYYPDLVGPALAMP